MAIIGNNTQISVNASGEMIVQTGGTDRLTYNYTHGTLKDSGHVSLYARSGFAGDTSPGVNDYLDAIVAQVSKGTFTLTAAGRFTVPRTGAYRMTAGSLCRTNWHHWPAKNDSQFMTGAHNTYTGGYNQLGWSALVYATAGDTLSWRGNQNSGKTWGGDWSTFTIDYIG